MHRHRNCGRRGRSRDQEPATASPVRWGPSSCRERSVRSEGVGVVVGQRECDLCGAREARVRYRMDGFHIVRCVQCDLTYVAEKVDPAFLKRYYGEAYYTGAQPKGYADYIGQRESRKRHFRSLIPGIKHHLE